MQKLLKRFYINKKTVSIVLMSVLLGITSLFLVNEFFKDKIQSQINKKYKNFEFDKYSKMSGFSTNFDNVTCKGFIYYNCVLDNFRLEADLNGTKRVVLQSKYTTVKTQSITNPMNFDLKAKEIYLGTEFDTALFGGYEEPYKTISNNIRNYLLPTDLNLLLDIKRKSKNISEGSFRIYIKNNSFITNLNSGIYIDSREYNEIIKVPNEVDSESVGEIHSSNVPFYGKLDNINYYIEDVDFKGFLFELYRLNGENIKRDMPHLLEGYNTYYLAEEKNHILSKEEFLIAFEKMVKSYIESVPDEEASFKRILYSLEKLLNGSIKAIELKAKNIGNTTIEKTGLLFMLDEFNTTRRYLDDSFDIKIKEIK